MLSVSLLQIAQSSNKLLTGNIFVVGQQVTLGGLAGKVDEDVRIGGHACYGTDHVALDDIS
jgi:hypothetical protein